MPSLPRLIFADLIKTLPLPFDHKLIATARGLQLIGIVACCLDGRSLTSCACFVDVVKLEGKQGMKALIAGGVADWTGLHTLEWNPIGHSV
ncbi:MAG: hypothetical protein JF888_10400 [Candidatus Dormibacteraeota bacterium]|uniref:Uncharacterized protein n=1 Tax=Candidatus Dormiibacter inghamiae TaxID=3127013 RepID=A0A934KIS8_9BACT|nr:hypothetical protein [Candidatus Dormibacteraeota bacterium]MBJ7607450.1 hypothetical protein [Candidatus Dormibacteraeota bacterium]